jgi:hypothetical protein
MGCLTGRPASHVPGGRLGGLSPSREPVPSVSRSPAGGGDGVHPLRSLGRYPPARIHLRETHPAVAQAIVTRRAETRRQYRGAPFAQARSYRAYANRARCRVSGMRPKLP